MPSFQISLAWRIIAVISLPFKLVMVLARFPNTSSCNPACYIQGLIHGIGRGVPNASTIEPRTVSAINGANGIID